MTALVLAYRTHNPLASLFFMVGMVIVVLAVQRQLRRPFESACRRAARVLGGEFEPSVLFQNAAIRFTIEGLPARMEFQGGRGAWTRIQVDLQGRGPGYLKIVERSLVHSLRNLFDRLVGDPAVPVGNAVFDEQCVVRSTPPALVGRIFSPERRPRVLATLRRLDGFSAPSLQAAQSLFEVQVRNRLQDEASILALARVAREFVGYLLELDWKSGIVWIEAPVPSDARCPVCGAAILERFVRCGRCNVPHHEECWAYLGKCSIYACGGEQPRRRAA